MHFESLVSLSLDTKINNIVSIALATYMPLLDGWLLKTHSNVVRRENAKLNIKLYLIIYFLFLPTLLIPLSNRLRNNLSYSYRGCLCVDVGGLYPSWSADMQKQTLGIWLFCCAGRSSRSGECKVASFAPDPNPIKGSKKISNVIRAMMGSLQLHFPCSLAAGIACSGFPVGSVITSRKFCTTAHQETGAYWFKGFPVIAPAPDH